MTELIGEFATLDSTPKFKPAEVISTIITPSKDQLNFFKILKTINNNSLTGSEEGYQVSDSGMFLCNDGWINYKGTGVQYKYIKGIELSEAYDNEMLYGEIKKDEIHIDNHYINACKSDPFDCKEEGWSEWHKVPKQEWYNMCDLSDTFSYEMNLIDGIKINANKWLFYFPWKYWNDKLERDIEIIPIYRYKHEANSTKLVFMYNITHEGKTDTVSVNIEQHMQVIKY